MVKQQTSRFIHKDSLVFCHVIIIKLGKSARCSYVAISASIIQTQSCVIVHATTQTHSATFLLSYDFLTQFVFQSAETNKKESSEPSAQELKPNGEQSV